MHLFSSHSIVAVLLISICIHISNAQEHESLSYYGPEYFLLEGSLIPDSLKENRYDRLPAVMKTTVREPVWDLSKSAAGLSVRFLSNSSKISVKWTLMKNFSMNHMAETGIKGIDLYYLSNGTFQYLNTARPNGKENEFLLAKNLSGEMREYTLYLPLYDGITDLQVGIDSGSTMLKPQKSNLGSIVFYGTSITQGGCASRPGMAHTNIISRKLNVEVVNLGFSGNGKMEAPINELIATFDPLFYVIECLPNMDAQLVSERSLPLVETIRALHSETPILFVENFYYENAVLDPEAFAQIHEKNEALKTQYQNMLAAGHQNIYYISTDNATGNDHEGTVDGVHFTDLGFLRYADFLIEQFKALNLLTQSN
ncbi:MAG: hypothetical protein RLZZ241_615 [Bacteroidota bacterium]|jgi:hypothetical protein